LSLSGLISQGFLEFSGQCLQPANPSPFARICG
jgi:hypothetical protein